MKSNLADDMAASPQYETEINGYLNEQAQE
jgi:hypothetical protein